MELYFCSACSARIPEEDVRSGAALVDQAQGTVLCKVCAPASIHDMATGTDIRPIQDIPDVLPVKPDRRSSRSMLPAAPPSQRPRPGPPASKAPLIGLAAGGVMLLATALIFFLKPADPPKNSGKEADSAAGGAGISSSTVTSTTIAAKGPGPGAYRAHVRYIFPVDDNPDEYEALWMPWLRGTGGEALVLSNGMDPSAITADPAPLPAASTDGSVVLARLATSAFKGGKAVADVEKKGKDGRTIFGQQNPDAAMTARFDLKLPTSGPAKVAATAYRDAKAPCTIAVSINGHEVYRGPEPAEAANAWSLETFNVPDGIIQAGRNELRIANVEASAASGPPDYTVSDVQILGAAPAAPPPVAEPPKPMPKTDVAQPVKPADPEFPSVLAPDQKAALQFMDGVFTPLAKFDIDSAIRLAATDSTPAGKKLLAALNGAKDAFNKSVDAINKSGGTINVHVMAGTLDVTGQLLRIDGSKAWIKSRGLEAPADIGALPREVFVKALAANDSTPQGRLEKALLDLALGDLDGAVALMRKAGGHAESADFAALLDQRSKLLALQKFDSELNELSALASSDRAADVAGRIAKLKREAPELFERQKQRIESIAARAQAKK